MLEYQEKGTEVNTRTAKLYSKQGSTDLTVLMVVDEMTQCKVCREHNAEGKSFCKCGSLLHELSAEKTDTLKETTAQWRKGLSQGHVQNHGKLGHSTATAFLCTPRNAIKNLAI